MADVGRPTKFTPKTRERIYKSIKRGGTQEIIANNARIAVSTLNDWLSKGKNISEKVNNGELEYDSLTEIEKEYMEFSEQYYEDESDYLLNLIENTSDNKWLLAKRMKQHFGDETTVNLNAKVQTEISWKDLIENAANED